MKKFLQDLLARKQKERENLKKRALESEDINEAVSYTHLDVYKRQVLKEATHLIGYTQLLIMMVQLDVLLVSVI